MSSAFNSTNAVAPNNYGPVADAAGGADPSVLTVAGIGVGRSGDVNVFSVVFDCVSQHVGTRIGWRKHLSANETNN